MPDPTPTEDPGRQRLRSALLRPSRAQGLVAVLLAVVGFTGVTQILTYQADDTYAGYSEQALIDVLNGLASTSQRAQAEITRLEQTRSELQSATEAREAAVQQARTRVDTLEILAGTVPVNGPGIRITVEEETGPASVDSMLDTIQELRTARAESIQLNGQVRVIGSTSFEDVPGGMLVDGVILEAPYVIDAIGDPSALDGALRFAQGPISQFENDGATVDVVQLRSLDIESVRTAPRPEVAQPDPAQ